MKSVYISLYKSAQIIVKVHDIHLLYVILVSGVTGVWAGWAIAYPVFGRIEGASRQWQCAALLLAHPVLGSQLCPPSFWQNRRRRQAAAALLLAHAVLGSQLRPCE